MATTTTTRHSRKTSKTLLEPTGKELETYEAPRLVIPVDPSRDHIQGDPKALLTLVEYGDYQCPFCGAAYPEVKKVQKDLGSKLRFVFRISGAAEWTLIVSILHKGEQCLRVSLDMVPTRVD